LIHIAVRYMAQVRQAAGVAAEEVELGGACPVGDLLARLAERHGAPLRRLLLDAHGAPQRTLLVFVGNEQVAPGERPLLADGDVVTVLSPMAGG
jgi:molybdopterin converting factor small subunit